LLKIVARTPVSGKVCATKLWSISSACANLMWQHSTELGSFEKFDLCGSKLPCPTWLLVDQSSPDFFAERGRNCCRQFTFPILDISLHSRDIRGRSLKLSEKFYVDRPRELGDLAVKKETSAVNIRPLGTNVPDGLIKGVT